MKESKIIVFDLMKEDNLFVLDPYSLLLFLTKKLPAIAGMSVLLGPQQNPNISNLLITTFRPASLERDDAIILIKSYLSPKEQFDEPSMKIVVDAIINGFSDDDFVQIGNEMKKFVVKKTAKNMDQKTLFDKIIRLNLNTKHIARETKVQMLRLWFTNAISGPFCITRALDIVSSDHVLHSDAISCSITREIKNNAANSFWNFNMSYLMVTDTNYYVISGDINEAMDFPSEVNFTYIGLREPGIKYKPFNERASFRFPSLWRADRNEKNASNEYYLVVVFNPTTNTNRLKVQYGNNVFPKIHSLIMHIANSTRFDVWCRDSVQWEIWFGRDEQIKLKDYRALKQQNKILNEEIASLKRQLVARSNDGSSVEILVGDAGGNNLENDIDGGNNLENDVDGGNNLENDINPNNS